MELLMRKLAALSAVLLTGCWGTVPVVPDFPKLPESTTMTVPCPELKALKADPTISDISSVLNQNYHQYYECAVRVDAWNDWYRQQRDLYNKSLNK